MGVDRTGSVNKNRGLNLGLPGFGFGNDDEPPKVAECIFRHRSNLRIANLAVKPSQAGCVVVR